MFHSCLVKDNPNHTIKVTYTVPSEQELALQELMHPNLH